MYEHAVWQCIGRKCSDWPRGALGRRGALYHGLPSWPTRQVAGVKNESRAMRALTVGLEHKQSAESAHPTPPSPRLGSFICRESFSVYSQSMATMATMATPKLKLKKK